jgi:hypothetical protein
MSERPDDFDPESPEEREIGGAAARARSAFLSLMRHGVDTTEQDENSFSALSDTITGWFA